MNKRFIFSGGDHYTIIEADLKTRQLKIQTERTGDKLVKLGDLLPLDKMAIIKKHTKDMNEKDFEKYIKDEFLKMGYTLKKIENVSWSIKNSEQSNSTCNSGWIYIINMEQVYRRTNNRHSKKDIKHGKAKRKWMMRV